MKIAIIKEKEEKETILIKEITDTLVKKYHMQVDCVDSVFQKKEVLRDLNEYELIIVFNLAGFEQCTLTNGLSYNLIDSKFINLLLRENLSNEGYLARQLSISMFFYCADEEYCNYLLEQYPDIPYLKLLEGWKGTKSATQVEKDNSLSVIAAIEEVMKECHLA